MTDSQNRVALFIFSNVAGSKKNWKGISLKGEGVGVSLKDLKRYTAPPHSVIPRFEGIEIKNQSGVK